jgi:putative Ca2+/H+ antiporter (TMEM165/GDT1 family)
MDWRAALTVFTTMFLAELGDKTQLAAMSFSAKAQSGQRWPLFVVASLAMVAATGLGVLGGAIVGRHLDPRWMSRVAGGAFVIIGIWTIARA